MERFVFLKLGGSAITDKTREFMPRADVIRQAAREVARARERDPNLRVLLGHGSGSFGHFAAVRSGFGQPNNWRAYAETGAAANRLNRIVADIFLEESVPVVSLQPSASARCHDGELISLEVTPIRAALEQDLIPLVYGDVAFDDTRGMSIASTEKIFGFLAPILKPECIIYAGQVNGIYSTDPLKDADAKLIPEITPASFSEIETGLGGAHGVDVTGGMLDKVRRSLRLIDLLPRLRIAVIAAQDGLIERALIEEQLREGTQIHAESGEILVSRTMPEH